MRIELRFSVHGRARFLSHLECVDMLLAALRRAGFEVALSQGMRPKPVISLAMARAVGVEADEELATVELAGGEHDPDDVMARLNATLPRGMQIIDAGASAGTPRITAATYRVRIDAPRELLERAAARYAELETAPIRRVSPKRTKTVDVKRWAPDVTVVDDGFEVEAVVDMDGTARPEEVARALAECIGAPLPVLGITRTELRAQAGEVPAARQGEHA